MKVGLIDLDAKLPNLALMKLKSYYPEAELTFPLFCSGYDEVYASSIFKFSDKRYIHSNVIPGGTGFDITSRLPADIEACQPDYSIYPGCDFSWQRFTYGCIRKCGFCVSWKMGDFQELEPMNLNPAGKYIYLLDNNFFASVNWKENIGYLVRQNKPVKFEGIDARIIAENDEMLHLLNKVKLKGRMHTAWDIPSIDMMPKFKKIIKVIKPYKIMCYVLVGFDSTPEDDLHRVLSLDAIGIDPFVMPFNKRDRYVERFARWVNHKAIFKSVKWEDYK